MAIAMTDENRAKLNALVRLLRKQTMTKQEIMAMFDTNERTARDMVSEVAKRCPIPSNSESSGYKIATRREDIPAVIHAINENNKRAAEILKRNEPLKKFLEEITA